MLFLVVSTPRPERPSDVAANRQSFWPWIADYRGKKICKHIYPRVGRGAVAVFDVESNNDLHRILNEWADIIPAHFDTYPLVDTQATAQLLAAQVAKVQFIDPAGFSPGVYGAQFLATGEVVALIPEPSTGLMLLSGSLGLLGFQRRRRRA